MQRLVLAYIAGAVCVIAHRNRRGIAREWRWAVRDLRDFRAELAQYFR